MHASKHCDLTKANLTHTNTHTFPAAQKAPLLLWCLFANRQHKRFLGICSNKYNIQQISEMALHYIVGVARNCARTVSQATTTTPATGPRTHRPPQLSCSKSEFHWNWATAKNSILMNILLETILEIHLGYRILCNWKGKQKERAKHLWNKLQHTESLNAMAFNDGHTVVNYKSSSGSMCGGSSICRRICC